MSTGMTVVFSNAAAETTYLARHTPDASDRTDAQFWRRRGAAYQRLHTDLAEQAF
jgi:hypothetical protein